MRVHFIVHESFEAPGAYWTAPALLNKSDFG